MKKLPGWLLRIDPNAKLEKTTEGWMADVHGGKFCLGRTKEEWGLGLEMVIERMRAAKINVELGLPSGALTGLWVVRGYDNWGNSITLEDGKRIAGKIRYRHLATDYDDLLKAGVSRDDAREMTSYFDGEVAL